MAAIMAMLSIAPNIISNIIIMTVIIHVFTPIAGFNIILSIMDIGIIMTGVITNVHTIDAINSMVAFISIIKAILTVAIK